MTKYIVVGVVALQLLMAYLLRNTYPLSWTFIIAAYVIGGTANQNLFLAIHEITHNLAFKSIRANKIFAIFANIPVAVPFAMMFKAYHIEHHKFLGVDDIDTDLPTKFELILFSNVLGKAFFCTFQILFYALRPMFIKSQPLRLITLANIAIILSIDYAIAKSWGINAFYYLLMSSFMAGSLHPCAAHFIAEHYVFEEGLEDMQETWSYYGPLNYFTWNVGYHQEHHDFPNIAWSRLPALHGIAKDTYGKLPSHKSWPMVTIRFIFDERVGLFARVKRKGGGKVKGDEDGRAYVE